MARQIALRLILFLSICGLALTQLTLLLTTGDDLYSVRNYSVRLDLRILLLRFEPSYLVAEPAEGCTYDEILCV